MSNAMIDLKLIEAAQDLLQKDSDSSLAATRKELSLLYDQIRQSISTSQYEEDSERLLPGFLKSNPEIFNAISEQVVREALEYVSGVCNYYKSVTIHRPLTEEERGIGRQLSQILRSAQDLL